MTNTKITYTQQGDYLLPDLKLPEQPKVEIGIFGKRHLRYLERNRKILYTNLLTKAENQMLWVKKMNSIRNRAEEIVNHELIYS